MIDLSLSSRYTSLALGQSYDCPSASEVILKDMGKHITWTPQELNAKGVQFENTFY